MLKMSIWMGVEPIQIERGVFRGRPLGNSDGIVINDAANTRVGQNLIGDNRGYGMLASSTAGTRIQNNVISRNEAANIGLSSVEDVVVGGSTQALGNQVEFSRSDHGVFVFDGKNVVSEHNFIEGNAADGINVVGNILEAVSVVPEPSTLVLASLSLLPLGFIGWRHRRRT